MKEINCDVIRDLLPLYADNAASRESRELVREHIADCPDCMEELVLMRSLVSLPPDEDAKQVLQSFRERKAKQRRKENIGFFCVVAAAVLAIVFYYWYTRPLTLDRLCRQFPWDQATEVYGYEHTDDEHFRPVAHSVALPLDDPQAQAIYQRLLAAKFKRDPHAAWDAALGHGPIWYFGEAGGIPNLVIYAPGRLVVLTVAEDGTARLSSGSIDTHYLRCTDETLVQDLLTYLRAHRVPLDQDADSEAYGGDGV